MSVVAEEAAGGVKSPSPQVLWNGTTALLVVEEEIVTTCPKEEIPIALLAAYFNFNISYPKGSSHFYSILEILLLDRVPVKVHSKVATILSALQNIELE